MGNASSEDLDRKVAALLVALEKLPPHRGVSFRGRPPLRPQARAAARPARVFRDQLALELGEAREQVEHQLAAGRTSCRCPR